MVTRRVAGATPLEVLARQNAAIEDLTRTVEAQQVELDAWRDWNGAASERADNSSDPGRLAGIRGHGIAPCGTAVTARQIAAVSRAADLPARGVRVALDGDPAGRQAALRACPLLQPATADITAVILPDGQDPADILTAGRPASSAGRSPLACARWRTSWSTPRSSTGHGAATPWTPKDSSAPSAPPPPPSPRCLPWRQAARPGGWPRSSSAAASGRLIW